MTGSRKQGGLLLVLVLLDLKQIFRIRKDVK
jgi:hypothetical protein